jgi:hypothetical protein
MYKRELRFIIATLSRALLVALISSINLFNSIIIIFIISEPERIRTFDRQLRRLMLYPTELLVLLFFITYQGGISFLFLGNVLNMRASG